MTPEEIKNLIEQEIKNHYHNGLDSRLLKIENIFGMIGTVATVPTHTPRNLFEQFVIYTNGATLRFYWYDTTNNLWHYVTATA